MGDTMIKSFIPRSGDDMKLYVWRDVEVLQSHCDGLACVMARSVDEARAMLRARLGVEKGGFRWQEDWGAVREIEWDVAKVPIVLNGPEAVVLQWGSD
jgi:hypothetical protein